MNALEQCVRDMRRRAAEYHNVATACHEAGDEDYREAGCWELQACISCLLSTLVMRLHVHTGKPDADCAAAVRSHAPRVSLAVNAVWQAAVRELEGK